MNKEDLDLLKKLNTKELCDYVYNIYTRELNNINSDLAYFKKEIKNKRHDTTFKHLTNLVYCKNKKFCIRKYLFKNKSVNRKFNYCRKARPMFLIYDYMEELEKNKEEIEKYIYELTKDYYLYNKVFIENHFDNFYKLNLVNLTIYELYNKL